MLVKTTKRIIARECLSIIKTKRHHLNTASTTELVQSIDDIPSPKSLPIFGTTLSFLMSGSGRKLHEYIDKRHHQLGSIFKETIGPTSAIFISNPNDIRTLFANEGKYPTHFFPDPWILYNETHGCSRGLFFMNGEEWLKNRKIMNKFLLRGDFKWIDDSCMVVVEDLLKRFLNNHNKLEENLYTWSLETLISVLLGAESYQKNKHFIREDIEDLSKVVHLIFEKTCKFSIIPAKLASTLNLPQWTQFESTVTTALDNTKNLVEILVKDYSKNSTGLLSKMLTVFDMETLTKIVTDLIIASGDTTSHSMEFILYLIGKHQNVQNNLFKSLKSGPNPPILKGIFKEGLRLYPVAPFLTRFLAQDTILNGYKVPKNTLVIASIYTTGRDSNYYENSNEFKPERWMRTNDVSMQQILPFAIGARSCIGRRIAEAQIMITLAEIVKIFNVTLKNNQKEIEMILKMVAIPSRTIELNFTPR
ncbi:cytochrome P450 315a1, mitochondrial [Onthophagus taurus]|uniref:cytochrome P450 315a1, mitochondrial n=1 Tax=Onthophagus taurus TaxID=166361 RepID=UPI000C202AE0|nr:cytochrome P450 315a1, mitochondrial [Onthophagus taurus]